jgi:uncharacterized protein GlcG (DUF336 family)
MNTSKFTALCCLLISMGTAPALAEDATFDITLMTPETAMKVAKVALDSCRSKGYQVAVVVVDRMGVPQAMVRDRYAGAHTPDTAFRKAWTAVSFRADTLALAEMSGPGSASSGARDITNALMVGGGVPIEAAGSTLGAVGVSGAPTPEFDQECARTGIAAVSADLEF